MAARKVLITGASAGIGKECARQFAAHGDELILISRRDTLLHSIRSEFEREYKNKIHVIPCDLSQEGAMTKMFETHGDLLCQTDVLVNNAGVVKGWAPFYKSSAKDWQLVIDTNVKAVLFMIQKIVPSMIAKRRGHVVNIGSVAGRWTYPNDAVYCATKHAVRTLGETLRAELKGTGVRLTTVEPGPTKTDLTETRHNSKDIAQKAFASWTPLMPEDIAETVFWAAGMPPNCNASEIVVFPVAQASIFMTDKTMLEKPASIVKGS